MTHGDDPALHICTVTPTLHLLQLLLGINTLNLEVPSNEELQKQKQIRSVHDKGRHIILLLNLARLFRIGIGHVIVKRQQRHGNANNHLTNLKARNDHGIEPFGFHSDGH
jgi:hypothetical protein